MNNHIQGERERERERVRDKEKREKDRERTGQMRKDKKCVKLLTWIITSTIRNINREKDR